MMYVCSMKKDPIIKTNMRTDYSLKPPSLPGFLKAVRGGGNLSCWCVNPKVGK